MNFEWDERKNQENILKHGVSFEKAQMAFLDENLVLKEDKAHSTSIERRFYCIGYDGNEILTVRFTIRNENIRIYGAGYWRKEKKIYEEKNNLH